MLYTLKGNFYIKYDDFSFKNCQKSKAPKIDVKS